MVPQATLVVWVVFGESGGGVCCAAGFGGRDGVLSERRAKRVSEVCKSESTGEKKQNKSQ